MSIWNGQSNKNLREKRFTRGNFVFESRIIDGEQVIQSEEENNGKQESKVINGGCVDQFAVGNMTVMVGADSKNGTKNGADGAKLACETLKLLLEMYNKVYNKEKAFIKAVTSDEFAKQLGYWWKNLVLVHYEEQELLKREREKKISLMERLGLIKEKNNDENDEDKEEIIIDEKQVLKDYATSVMFALITDEEFILLSSGQGGFVLYNMYEGRKVFGSVDNSTLLDESLNIKFACEKHRQDVYSGILMMSDKLSCLLPDAKSSFNYAKQLDRTLSRGGDAFVYIEENGARNSLSTALKEYGAFVALAVNTKFKLSAEKEKEYRDIQINKSIEEGRKAREQKIQQSLELAKDKTVYVTYDNPSYEGYENIKIFAARRQGRSHVAGNIPCQDYCLTGKVNKGVVLAVSDGIGSCPKSDDGSKFACKALLDTVKFADERSNNEEVFVSLLQSVDFRKKVFTEWRNAVINEERSQRGGGGISFKDIEQYGATLLFAVITENYYVIGNIGDGQVLLYNQSEATKIRKHLPKESTSTRSMADYNGFGETFIVEKYRRSDFSSVILSTDGIYDPLENGDEFYKYAKETEKRFLEKNEPYQPFCYTVNEKEGYKELYSSNTYDDCTIVLATDVKFDNNGKDLRRKAIEEKYNYTIVESLGDISVYASSDENGAYTTVVSKNQVSQPKIDGIKFFDIIDQYESCGYYYNVYKYADDMSLNKMYQCEKIGEQKETKPKASYLTLKVYEDLLECIEILDKSGYALDQQLAHNLIVYNDKTGLILYPEAIVKKEEGVNYDNRRIRALFESLFGKLVCGEESYPLFNLDSNNVGGSKYLTPNGETTDYVGVIVRVDGQLYFANCGERRWFDMNDNPINKGERIPLNEGELFKIVGVARTRVYSFVEKKNF